MVDTLGSSKLGQSAEDYLEAVLVLGQSGHVVRVTDLAERLAVSKPSVVAALASLGGKGLVKHERYGGVELTVRGTMLAEEVYRRHQLLQKFLRDVLGVPDAVAAKDACRIEHVLSPETVERLVEFVREHGNGEPVSLSHMREHLDRPEGKPKRSGR